VPRWARFEYWRAPEKTAAAWRGDLVTVGDLGRIDDDGTVWLDGRREDLVISGGVNVYPAEVEAVLDAHPHVVESAVFGVPDGEWGQRVVAAYVGTAEPAELTGWARERLAPAKRPKSLHRLDELPRTSTGKVRRLDLPEVLGLGSA
jgi:acyl-CoA synthetase (AMP-forming)/AMP-acid ligase II